MIYDATPHCICISLFLLNHNLFTVLNNNALVVLTYPLTFEVIQRH